MIWKINKVVLSNASRLKNLVVLLTRYTDSNDFAALCPTHMLHDMRFENQFETMLILDHWVVRQNELFGQSSMIVCFCDGTEKIAQAVILSFLYFRHSHKLIITYLNISCMKTRVRSWGQQCNVMQEVHLISKRSYFFWNMLQYFQSVPVVTIKWYCVTFHIRCKLFFFFKSDFIVFVSCSCWLLWNQFL